MKVLEVIVRSSMILALSSATPGLRGSGDEYIGEVHAESTPTRNLAGASEESGEAHGEMLADTLADVSTGLDIPGPYTEEPSEEEAASPRPAEEDWENATSLQGAFFNTWGQSFCETHRTGFFCDGTTRVRCCRKSWGFVKCGTTWHSNTCGWNGGGYTGGGGSWHIHQGWRQSSFCQSHHVGWFCYSHHKTHCCNDYGHFVDCTTTSQTSWRC